MAFTNEIDVPLYLVVNFRLHWKVNFLFDFHWIKLFLLLLNSYILKMSRRLTKWSWIDEHYHSTLECCLELLLLQFDIYISLWKPNLERSTNSDIHDNLPLLWNKVDADLLGKQNQKHDSKSGRLKNSLG